MSSTEKRSSITAEFVEKKLKEMTAPIINLKKLFQNQISSEKNAQISEAYTRIDNINSLLQASLNPPQVNLEESESAGPPTPKGV